MTPAISFRQVCYRIGDRTILSELSFEVPEGETVVLLGRSGSGKTTALKMVNGMLFPSDGQVLVDGEPTTAWDPIALKRRIGYVIQEVGLFPHYTVERNVGLVPCLEGWPAGRVRERVRELLEMVGLPPEEFAGRYPSQLSGGQRQRVGVARALAADPPVLLLDEPFGALDPVTRLEVQRQFQALQQRLRKTSLFVTHDIREGLQVGTRIGVLDQGRLETLAAPAEFLSASGPETRAFLACLNDGEQG